MGQMVPRQRSGYDWQMGQYMAKSKDNGIILAAFQYLRTRRASVDVTVMEERLTG